MLNAITIREQEDKLEQAAIANTAALDDLLHCLRIYGDRGKRRITRFIEEAGDDGQSDTGSQ
jgi:hypothetical protein